MATAHPKRRFDSAVGLKALLNDDTVPIGAKLRDTSTQGLYLVKTATGGKWVFRFTRDGKTREMGLGTIRDVGLKEARQDAQKHRSAHVRGHDPIQARRQAQEDARTSPRTFVQEALDYIGTHRAEWTQKHCALWQRTFELYAFPKIGDRPIEEINVEDVLGVLEPLWHKSNPTAIRLRGRIERVLEAAIARGTKEGHNPAEWKRLRSLLANPGKIHQKRPMRMLDYQRIPELIGELRCTHSTAARMVELAILAALRAQEARLLEWDQIQEDRIEIPMSKRKDRKDLVVPVTGEIRELLDRMRPPISRYVFPSTQLGHRDKPISPSAHGWLLKRMQCEGTLHGFRASFRSWCFDHGHSDALAELALGHRIANEVERAYQRSDGFERRRRMMAEWTSYCVEGDRQPLSLVKVA